VYHRHAVHGFAAERQDVRRTNLAKSLT
jgi:hypothetical protein